MRAANSYICIHLACDKELPKGEFVLLLAHLVSLVLMSNETGTVELLQMAYCYLELFRIRFRFVRARK